VKKLLTIITILSFFVNFSQSKKVFDYENQSSPNSENELSLYFKNQISKKLLKRIKFQPKKNNIVLSFSINKENEPYRVNVSTFRSNNLKKEIKKAFKNYPLEKLNLHNFDKSNRYSLQIITRKNNKGIFNCSSKIIIESPPICNNCSYLEYYEDIKTCLNLAFLLH
jgi:hypothetical protein